MLFISQENSTKLFERMDNDEIRYFSQAMAGLGPITSAITEQLFVEFSDQLTSSVGLVGSYSSTELLLMGALPADHVSQIMEEICAALWVGPCGTSWEAQTKPSGKLP